MKTFQLVIAAVAAFGIIACGGGGNKPPPAHPVAKHAAVDFPEWVMKGSGAFAGDAGKMFVGVGSASGIKNHSLAISTADNRARAEVSKTFSVYSASLMKDYMASTTAGDMSASSEEQHVEQAIKTFSAETLSGVVIQNHWFHPDGTVYAMAVLDLENFTGALEKMNELKKEIVDYVRENADKAHMDLEAEEERRASP
jgi:hypothetical protein